MKEEICSECKNTNGEHKPWCSRFPPRFDWPRLRAMFEDMWRSIEEYTDGEISDEEFAARMESVVLAHRSEGVLHASSNTDRPCNTNSRPAP